MLIWLFLAFLGICGIRDSVTTGLTSKKVIFFTYWGFANGPLAFATVFLNNAIVLHDIENLASCYIHLSPALLTWTMRWFSAKYEEHWPGVFGLPIYDE